MYFWNHRKIVSEYDQTVLNYDVFLSLNDLLIIANSVDPDEMQQLCCISSGSSLFAKVPSGVSRIQRVKHRSTKLHPLQQRF